MGREMLCARPAHRPARHAVPALLAALRRQGRHACIHQWNALPLGSQPGGTTMLVLLLRDQLLECFPNLSIYAYRIVGAERPGGTSPPRGPGSERDGPAKAVLPVLRGHLGRDISYVGFPIAPEDVGQCFFIVEEHMTEPRFGFDDASALARTAAAGRTWTGRTSGSPNGSYFGRAALQQARPAMGNRALVDPHAATVADAALQRPLPRLPARRRALRRPAAERRHLPRAHGDHPCPASISP